MQTLKQLTSGQLLGAKKLKLACGLTHFPKEIYTLEDTLETLDLTDNALSSLPDDFHRLKHLKILFLSNNHFTHVPPILSQCPNLTMIGIRNNQIDTFAENVLPLSTRWLILTDNHLEKLPESIGDLQYLQKCMLSGNELLELPRSLAQCKNLELLRVSANKLSTLPTWLLSLPKLSWLAYSGNPFCDKHPSCDTPIKEIYWDTLEVKEVLGEGASGLISKAIYQGKEVAVKVFKGSMTSDGLPQEEMDINISMGQHPHLIDVLAKVTKHPQGNDVLMLELIPANYFNLGLPPTFESCTRDVYADSFTLSFAKALKIIYGMATAAVHMHERGIMHGDFYAHNIMIDSEGNSILGDFGGASYFEPKETTVRQSLERLEVRAFGCLIEEMLLLSTADSSHADVKASLTTLKEHCLNEHNEKRPLFQELYTSIKRLNNLI